MQFLVHLPPAIAREQQDVLYMPTHTIMLTACTLQPELMVQTICMPVQVFSGIRPPQALLDAMSHPGVPQPAPHGHFTPQSPSASSRPPAAVDPSPNDLPADAPPSYEDAIADDLGPIDGPRREYSQPEQPQVQGSSAGGGEKTMGRLFSRSGH